MDEELWHQGRRGATGPKGDTGKEGPQGEPGAPGPKGERGVGVGDTEILLARLETKVDNLREVVVPLQGRIDGIAENLEERLRKVEEKTTRLEERLTLWQTFQTAYATIVGAIAAWLGSR